jgi:hypothetical protein
MGNQQPSPKYLYFDSEQQFWANYYKQTTDYSVGNATTLVNEKQKTNSAEILTKWKSETGKYYFPDPKYLYKETGDYSVGCMATVTSNKECNKMSNIKSSEILKRWNVGGYWSNTFYFPKSK